jgi:D-alanine-D-alanine ligase
MQTIVGVLRGGPSREHEISLKTGGAMLANLNKDRFDAHDIYIDKQGQWHDRGRPTTPDRILHQLDVVLNGLHGEYGEVQKLLEKFGVRYTGSDHLGSYLAMHKVMSKMRAREAGLLTPDFYHVERLEDAARVVAEVHRKFIPPVVVKPVSWGSSVGVSIVGGHLHILKAVQDLFEQGALGVLIEERIRGREATAGIVEGLRDQVIYQLPVTAQGLTRVEVEELKRDAKIMHRALGLRHYSESEFIVSPRGVYYLETNSLPSLGVGASMASALASVGVQAPDFFAHLANLALSR